DAVRVTDKLPFNFQRIGLLALLLPRAQIIHCRRDPYDTCLSCYFQDFQERHTFAYEFERLGKYYREYERLMAHWRSVLPHAMLEVPYEALVADPEPWCRRILAHCGLPWDERALSFFATDRAVRTASYWQVRQPIYASSVGRWKHYRKHLAPLFAALGRTPPEEDAA
ncbi:MAG TPA: sulfotransferase, partial [Alphaproteobacteria bacterium]|nr:sulfotransferase [Alphaproteobacteria bacterium]